jgi:hypothetical protein
MRDYRVLTLENGYSEKAWYVIHILVYYALNMKHVQIASLLEIEPQDEMTRD